MTESCRKYGGAARICLAAALFSAATGGIALAQPKKPGFPKPSEVPAKTDENLILGEIQSIAVDNMSDPSSGGRMVLAGKQISIPKNLLIGLPEGRITLRNLVLDAPEPCKAQQPPQSGLAVSDWCRGDGPPALARVVASASASGELVAGVVMIQKDSGRTLARIKPQRGARAGSYGRRPSGTAASPKPPGAQPK